MGAAFLTFSLISSHRFRYRGLPMSAIMAPWLFGATGRQVSVLKYYHRIAPTRMLLLFVSIFRHTVVIYKPIRIRLITFGAPCILSVLVSLQETALVRISDAVRSVNKCRFFAQEMPSLISLLKH